MAGNLFLPKKFTYYMRFTPLEFPCAPSQTSTELPHVVITNAGPDNVNHTLRFHLTGVAGLDRAFILNLNALGTCIRIQKVFQSKCFPCKTTAVHVLGHMCVLCPFSQWSVLYFFGIGRLSRNIQGFPELFLSFKWNWFTCVSVSITCVCGKMAVVGYDVLVFF